MRTLWISLLAVSLLIAAAPAVPAKVTVLKVPYSGPAPFGPASPEVECTGKLPEAAGVACFEVPRNAREMTFHVHDVSALPIGGSYYVYDAAGALVTMGAHCGGTSLDVPSEGLVVVRLDAVGGPTHCLAEGKDAGIPTKGIVQARLA